MNTRKNYQANFKSKVALEAMRGELTLSELSAKYGVSSKQIGRWKQQAIDGISLCFSDRKKSNEATDEAVITDLHAKIGELLVERDFLRKASANLMQSRGKK